MSIVDRYENKTSIKHVKSADKLMTPNGIEVIHADHDLKKEHFVFIEHCLEGVWWDWQGATSLGYEEIKKLAISDVFHLPSDLESITSGLYGPTAGDPKINEEEVTYKVRDNRSGPSRLIHRPTREVRKLCIIYVNNMILTAYGTQAAEPTPREWWDATMTPHEAVDSALFWSHHALSDAHHLSTLRLKIQATVNTNGAYVMGLNLCQSPQLLLTQTLECSCCKQDFYSKESSISTAIIFGAVRYSCCLLCGQEVNKPWSLAYKKRWDKWENKFLDL